MPTRLINKIFANSDYIKGSPPIIATRGESAGRKVLNLSLLDLLIDKF